MFMLCFWRKKGGTYFSVLNLLNLFLVVVFLFVVAVVVVVVVVAFCGDFDGIDHPQYISVVFHLIE